MKIKSIYILLAEQNLLKIKIVLVVLLPCTALVEIWGLRNTRSFVKVVVFINSFIRVF